MKIKFTNAYNNKEKVQSKEIDIKGNCVITNYPKGSTPSGAGDLTVTVSDEQFTLQKGSTIFDNNKQVDFNSSKYSVFLELAGASAEDSADELTLNDLKAARQNVSKFREFGVQNIKFDENKGVATIEMNNNEVLRIDFETESEAGVKPQSSETKKAPEPQTYTVKAGETLWSIAKQYNTTPEKLIEWNNLQGKTIQPNDVLFVEEPPKNASTQQKEEAKATEPKTYTVKTGDTLSEISQKTGKSVADIKKWNNLKNDTLQIEQVLYLEEPSKNASAKQKGEAKTPESQTYTVKTGDTLSEISQKTGKSVADIKKWNNLKNDTLQIEQVLYLEEPPKNASAKQKEEAKAAEPKTYTVKAGDSLGLIANKHNITIKQLKEWNNLKNETIQIGAVLFVEKPPKSASTQQKEETKATEPKTYTVKAGDSLGLIANKHNITIKQLKKWNNLKNETIQIGAVLFVEKPPKSASAKQTQKLQQEPTSFPKTYEGYREALAWKESSHVLTKVNKYEYIGLYQFGEAMLHDLGIYSEKGENYSKNDWKGIFKAGNEYNITSKSDFLSSPEKQEKVLIASMKLNWDRLEDCHKYVGTSPWGVKITKSGMLAAAHLVGAGNVKEYLRTGKVSKDANKTTIIEYLTKFAGYDVDSVVP